MIDLGAIIGSWFRGKGVDRYSQGPQPEQIFGPYDIATPLLQDSISRNVKPFIVISQNLASAGNMKLDFPGMHIVLWGYETGNAKKAVNTTFLVNMWYGQTKQENAPLPLKHNRGFSGPFTDLYLEWDAQASISVDIVVFAGIFTPWINGELAT